MDNRFSYFIHLTAVLEAMPDALVIIDEHGRIALVNYQTEALFKYERTRLIGEPVDQLMPIRFKDNHPMNQDQHFSSMDSGLELFGLKSDGTEFPMGISLSPLKTEEGRFTVVAIRDITVRKKTEAKFKSIIEATPDCLVIINNEGQIILANALAEKLFGYTKEQLIREKIELLIPQRYHTNHVDHRLGYFKHPRTRAMGEGRELYGLHKDGHEFPVEISLSPLETEDGLLALAAVRDITDRKLLDEKLLAKNIELENANFSKDRFLASMSHELRTPLNAIIGFTGTLLMKLPGPLNADQEKQLNIVKKSAKHLLSLINDLLDLAKIESGKVEIKLEKINCEEIIKDVVSTLTNIAESKGNKLNMQISEAEIFANTDRRALTQILINLTNNSIKFTENGVVEINTELRKTDRDEFIIINVIDTGIGIEKEDKDKLFKAFEQLKVPGKQADGTGLGLHISQKLAELIGGKIEFDSEYGKGTRFSVLIPKIKM
jgi:PAS domain S-box-containing protein